MQKNEMYHPDFFWQTICKINSPLKAAREKELKTDHFFTSLSLHKMKSRH